MFDCCEYQVWTWRETMSEALLWATVVDVTYTTVSENSETETVWLKKFADWQ